ncbi:Fur family transcriptional regulator [Dyadobacter alkalitolerans]|uniref:Fur family transcriptional regulator n=1 Tax=Dyadobacter alkalitolerans TaxID=492736 RepID=UPI000401E3CC|nr:transcriptional repressor [Dyadobacter alkalitolerans]
MAQVKKLLIKSKVRPTPNRIAVLDVFLREHKSLSHGRLQCLLNYEIDRVSLYRTLLDLVSANLLTRLVDAEGVAQFHFRQAKTKQEGILTPHFKCSSCEGITALPTLPETYIQQIASIGRVQQSRLLLEGICNECVRSGSIGKW